MASVKHNVAKIHAEVCNSSFKSGAKNLIFIFASLYYNSDKVSKQIHFQYPFVTSVMVWRNFPSCSLHSKALYHTLLPVFQYSIYVFLLTLHVILYRNVNKQGFHNRPNFQRLLFRVLQSATFAKIFSFLALHVHLIFNIKKRIFQKYYSVSLIHEFTYKSIGCVPYEFKRIDFIFTLP